MERRAFVLAHMNESVAADVAALRKKGWLKELEAYLKFLGSFELFEYSLFAKSKKLV